MNSNIYHVSKKILAFYSVGVIAFLGNSAITYIVSDMLHYAFLGSVILVFVFNISIIYRLQKKITFKAKNVSHSSYVIYVSWVIVLMLFLYFGGLYFKNLFGGTYGFASIVTMVIITILNFTVQSLLVFNTKTKK